MKPSQMLHQMCLSALSAVDVKALCKARGFPKEASASRGVLETMFLSSQGVCDVFEGLDASEVALLHLLKNSETVDVSFFGRVYGGLSSYGTYNQRFQNCFAKVKQRLVRTGVLLFAEAEEEMWSTNSKMERWQFMLPTEFHGLLPSLIPSSREFDGDGNSRPNVLRDKLIADLSISGRTSDDVVFQIEADELRVSGKPFESAKRTVWQHANWKLAIQGEKKKIEPKGKYSLRPAAAAFSVLSELPDRHWADAEQLAELMQVFHGKKLEADGVFEAGWEWGLLAKRQANGKTWYRPIPEQPNARPDQYLTPNVPEGCVTADLKTIPFDELERIIAISDQRAGSKKTLLLLTPNFIKLGRADDRILTSDVAKWLCERPPFAEVLSRLDEQRGKTILHENLFIAKVSDLSLKVAIEKSLSHNVVLLKNDFVAFPRGLLDDVRRVVKKSGHVIKEIAEK